MQKPVKTVAIKNIGNVSYYISSDLHFADGFGMVKEYGIAISCDRRDTLSFSHASVSHISDDENFIIKLIDLLASEQVLPIHLDDILVDLLG